VIPTDLRPVTCIHGFSQHGDSWDELASLVPGPYRWLRPDVGATGPAQFEAELLSLWTQERVERSHLVGYSQGGRLALWFAARHPGRLLSLTTISAHAGLEGDARVRRRRSDARLASRIEREGVDWFAAHWAALPIFAGLARRGPAFQAQLDRARRRNDPARLAATLRGLGGAALDPFWDRLTAIDVPTLLIAGAEDPAYVAFGRRLAGLIPYARLEVVAGAGHVVHLEQPEATARALAVHLAHRSAR
jgi:2-succinyl-6-hydroxy-2,4-cyclohexadiene-1-carboxylate synthase